MFRFTIRDVLCLMVVITVSGLSYADESRPTLKKLIQLASETPMDQDQVLDAVRWHLMPHREAQWGVGRHLLVVSWFTGNGRTALRYTVTEQGISDNVRQVYNHASQDWQRETLSTQDKNQLVEKVKALPESKAEPPINRTVHVSFQSGGSWRTETYDEAALPDEFEKVMQTIGERFETKNRQKKKPD